MELSFSGRRSGTLFHLAEFLKSVRKVRLFVTSSPSVSEQ